MSDAQNQKRICRDSQNRERAERARDVLDAYAERIRQSEEDTETNIGDLLADVHHLCRYEGLDFDRCLKRALMHFGAESYEEDGTE